uniref:CbiX/SirB N-terminal domain-containing protein n=1 Tax=Streptomyces vinaceusdrappus TaxID=67376 RepID=UPI0037048C50
MTATTPMGRTTGTATPGGTPALVVVAHGSRDPRALSTVRALLDRVRALRPALPVHLGHIELNAPLLPGTLAALGHREAVLVPLLLSRGRLREVPFDVVAPPVGERDEARLPMAAPGRRAGEQRGVPLAGGGVPRRGGRPAADAGALGPRGAPGRAVAVRGRRGRHGGVGGGGARGDGGAGGGGGRGGGGRGGAGGGGGGGAAGGGGAGGAGGGGGGPPSGGAGSGGTGRRTSRVMPSAGRLVA